MRYLDLAIQEQHYGSYSLVPIRFEDKENIRIWRNEQMFHLRQTNILSKEQQEIYFSGVVTSLFESKTPNQYLFSYLKNGLCIGYGGLVHIDYLKKSGELSFIMMTALESSEFALHWTNFLKMIEVIAFEGLNISKMYTWAYDIRPHLYPILESQAFNRERTFTDANVASTVVIHSKWNIILRKATEEDLDITYNWASNKVIRQFAFNREEILFDSHKQWFLQKIKDPNCLYFILAHKNSKIVLGSIRIDILGNTGTLSYLLDPTQHGKGYGLAMVLLIETKCKEIGLTSIIGEVIPENTASCAIFEKLGYSKTTMVDRIQYCKNL